MNLLVEFLNVVFVSLLEQFLSVIVCVICFVLIGSHGL
jgi:hypothetical protein